MRMIWKSESRKEEKLEFTQTEVGNLNFPYRQRGESVGLFLEGNGNSELSAISEERVKPVFLRKF